MEGLPFRFLLLSERYDRYYDPKKYKSDHNLPEKKIHKGRLSISVHMRFKHEVKKSDRN